MPNDLVLQAEQLCVQRGGKEVLAGVSFAVSRGEVFALLGGNGAGKSTTLATFLGFLPPAGGRVLVNGREVGTHLLAARRAMAYLPETASLYEHLDARENLRYFLQLAEAPCEPADIEAALDRVSLAPGARGLELRGCSKGMRQKVAIALAILRDTGILLLDEPTSGLDPAAIDEFHDLVRGLADAGKAILMVTHDVYGACQVADRIGLLRGGQLVDQFEAPAGGRIDTETVHRAFFRPHRHGVKQLLFIAGAEWRYWQRSRLALVAAVLLAVLLVATTVLSSLRMQGEAAERAHHQADAEAAFLSQPARHPHRMVHYGHYVFRAPVPLALFDPGLDPATGQSIFLEGHRQNTAMFAASGASADLGAFSWLSPAMVYQLFAPLLLILLGHGLIVREREAATLGTLLATLHQRGTPGRVLLAGKALALLSVVGLLLVPLTLSAALATLAGDSPLAAVALLIAYGVYLSIWSALALLASAVLQRRSAVLAALVTLWIALTLVLPAMAASLAAIAAPMPGKLETDLSMLAELRNPSDGHDANDPAFSRLRGDLLASHGVQRVEDLPVNLRGVVAQVGEEKLTAALNRYARAQMAAEARQATALAAHGWLTPLLAVSEASRAVAGTDLAHHHRFLREAEALRYAFVQGLNKVHAEKLAYRDDVRRSGDASAEERTRVDPSNWQLLGRFVFTPDAAGERITRAAPQWLMLGGWCFMLVCAGLWAGGRLQP